MADVDYSWDMEDVTVAVNGAGDTDDMNVIDEHFRILGATVISATNGEASEADYELVNVGESGILGIPTITKVDLQTRVDAAIEALKQFWEPHIRDTHIPIATLLDGDEGTQTRYFGRPWLPNDVAWPEKDGEPLRFVAQFDLASLPGKPLGDDGLLLFFHASEYSEDMSTIMVVDTDEPGGLRDLPEGIVANPVLQVIAWEAMPDVLWGDDTFDMPNIEKFEGLEDWGGCTIGEYVGEDGETYSEDTGVLKGIRPRLHTFECDKVGGWPRWEQGNETPDDENGNPMVYILQIGEDGPVGDFDKDAVDWPVYGRGQIFYSKDTGEFKFVWACD